MASILNFRKAKPSFQLVWRLQTHAHFHHDNLRFPRFVDSSEHLRLLLRLQKVPSSRESSPRRSHVPTQGLDQPTGKSEPSSAIMSAVTYKSLRAMT